MGFEFGFGAYWPSGIAWRHQAIAWTNVDYYPGTLSYSQVSWQLRFEDWAPINFVYGPTIFQRVALTWLNSLRPSDAYMRR